MSNDLAIASVTRTIRYMISRSADNTEDTTVTALSPDKAAQGSARRVNLFLYHTIPNAAWRNQDIPGRVKPGERGNPPLALNLHYLLTAYGEDNDEVVAQELLGRVMGRLHDRPILKSNYIRETLNERGAPDQSELASQIEKIRIIPEPLSIEEMSRLWQTFQTQYRVSAAYQASVVLIESQRPTPSALPVAKRGKDDRGVQTNLGLDAVLHGVEYRANPQQPVLPAANAGATVTIVGANLPATGLTVVVRDPKAELNGSSASTGLVRLTPTVEVAGKRLLAKLDENAGVWPAGMLSLELEYSKEGNTVSSNSVALALAPEIQTSNVEDAAIAFVNDRAGKRILSISLRQPLGRDRRVLLILNRFNEPRPDGSTPPQQPNAFYQIPQAPDDLGVGDLNPSFDVTKVLPGKYWLRIRVDGIDSSLMTRELDPETKRWSVTFDPKQKVTI